MSSLGKRKEPATVPSPPRARRVRYGFDTTPYKQFSSRPPVQSGDAIQPKKQEALKNLIKEELENVTFESRTVLDDIFGPVDDQLVDKVLGTLMDAGLGPENGTMHYPDASGVSCPFPATNAIERAFYGPWTSLLNATIRTTELILRKPLPFYTNLFFNVYDKEMKDSYIKSQSIKPDLLGLLASEPQERIIYRRGKPERKREAKVEKIFRYWWMVKIACEVKADWADMVAQMGTYGRCMLASIPSRRYALLIALNQKTMESRFCFFHRGGLMATPALKLLQQDDFRTFVHGMVQIAMCTNASHAGIDDTRDPFHYRLPHFGLRSIEHVLCDRGGLTGRGTRVSELGDAVPARYNPPHTQGYVKPGTGQSCVHFSDILDDVAYRKAATEEKVRTHFQLADGPAISLENLRVPAVVKSLETMDCRGLKCAVIKESSIPKDRATEEEVFRSAQGRFGIPIIICSYEVDGWGSIYCADATPWNVFHSLSPAMPHTQDVRRFVRTLYDTRGYPLFFALGPRQLLEGVLHAMIGHWELLQSGWLHRDISNGNILLLREPEKRQSCADFSETKDVTDCTSVLIDGDQAVNWRIGGDILGLRRSFTKPFVSSRITRALQRRQTVRVHTPLDDLESFLWVLVYTILEIGQCYGKLDDDEVPWLQTMTDEEESRLGLRITSLQAIVLATDIFRASDHLLIFREILAKWKDIAEASSAQLERVLRFHPDTATLVESSKAVYAEYLASGFHALSQLPTSWAEGWTYGAALRKADEEAVMDFRT